MKHVKIYREWYYERGACDCCEEYVTSYRLVMEGAEDRQVATLEELLTLFDGEKVLLEYIDEDAC